MNLPRIVTNNDLLGLMGMAEMECAVARMLNMAREARMPFSELLVKVEDFDAAGYERDGFWELNRNGWLEEVAPGGVYGVDPDLLYRVRRRYPEVK